MKKPFLLLVLLALVAPLRGEVIRAIPPAGGGSGGGAPAFDLSAPHTFTGANTFNTQPTVFGARVFISANNGMYLQNVESAATPSIALRLDETPDSPILATSTVSNVWLIKEANDVGVDSAVPLQTNPTLAIQSANQSTEQRLFLRHNQTQPMLEDGAVTLSSRRPVGFTGGSAVASAGTITPTGNVFHVTGTTGISAMTIMAAGTCVVLIFDGVVAITDGAGFNIGAAYTTSAADTLTMCSDGTNWFETGRSVN